MIVQRRVPSLEAVYIHGRQSASTLRMTILLHDIFLPLVFPVYSYPGIQVDDG